MHKTKFSAKRNDYAPYSVAKSRSLVFSLIISLVVFNLGLPFFSSPSVQARSLSNTSSSRSQTAKSINGNTCDEAGLSAALQVGGYIDINCPPNTTITLTSSPTIANYRSTNISTTLDASPSVSFTISGGDQFQAFQVMTNTNFSLNSLSIVHTKAPSSSNNPSDYGGAIANFGIVNINNSYFYRNNSQYGGAVFNLGQLTITNSSFISNTSSWFGGAIINSGQASVSNSAFSYNTATSEGGAISNYTVLNISSTLTIDNTSFNSNIAADSSGGGVQNEKGNLTVTNSTFNGNQAQNSAGGGIYTNYGNTSITNSTFFSNTARGGGGISTNGVLTVT